MVDSSSVVNGVEVMAMFRPHGTYSLRNQTEAELDRVDGMRSIAHTRMCPPNSYAEWILLAARLATIILNKDFRRRTGWRCR